MPGSSYVGKEDLLRDLFGAADVRVDAETVIVDGRRLPVLDGVIIALGPERLPPPVQARLGVEAPDAEPSATPFAGDVQASFGDEWTSHPDILPEHEDEFAAYFDLVALDQLGDARVCDLGCGIGRWSHFLAGRCREIVLVDFSEAIFVARRNLAGAENAVFVMADALNLPFRDGAFDLVVCLGVLHHLPVNALDAVRGLARLAPRLLVYLYYALDNRPAYFRWALRGVTAVRARLAQVRSPRVRSAVTCALAATLYVPAAQLGRTRLARHVPLAETYAGKSFARLRQDAYDRFFTSIEQRFTRDDILGLRDTFASVTVSQGLPYWHFLCERATPPG